MASYKYGAFNYVNSVADTMCLYKILKSILIDKAKKEEDKARKETVV